MTDTFQPITRAYTVRELDQLRNACRSRWLYGTTYFPPGYNGCSRSYKDSDCDAAVEQLARTHMIAGHTADDIYEADKPQ